MCWCVRRQVLDSGSDRKPVKRTQDSCDVLMFFWFWYESRGTVLDETGAFEAFISNAKWTELQQSSLEGKGTEKFFSITLSQWWAETCSVFRLKKTQVFNMGVKGKLWIKPDTKTGDNGGGECNALTREGFGCYGRWMKLVGSANQHGLSFWVVVGEGFCSSMILSLPDRQWVRRVVKGMM